MEQNLTSYGLMVNSPFIYFAVNRLRQCIGPSEGLASLLKVPLEYIENIPIDYLVHKNDIKFLNTLIDKGLENAYLSKRCVFRISFNKRDWYYIEINFKRIKGCDDMLACYCTDASEKIKLQQHSDKISRLLSSTGEVLHLGYWQLNIEQNILFWSDEIYKIHDLKMHDFIPSISKMLASFHPDDAVNIDNAFNQARTRGIDWSLEARIVRADGEIRHVITSGLPHKDEDTGKIDYIVGIFQDVTDLELVQEERDLLSCAVKTTVAGMVICDSDRKVIWTNCGFERLSGYALEEVKGHSLKDLLQGPDTDEGTVTRIKEALNNEQAISTEILNYTKNGHAYWNKLIITPILKNGKLKNFVGVQHDITEQIESKRQLLALNAKLEQRVKDRTSALSLAIQQLKKQADTDPLTGAYNRRALYHYFESFKENKRHTDKSLWLCILDIDHFKKINDEHGHDCGDRVLIQITKIIHDQIRDADRLFRIGGEEFVIALESIRKENAYHFVARLHSIIRATEFNKEMEKLKVTVSIGMHLVEAEESIDRSLVFADKLLYEAKQNGRDQIVLR